MGRQPFLAALGGGLLALAVVGGLLALDKTVLHVLFEEGGPVAAETDEPVTRWYYVEESMAESIGRRNDLPTCSWIRQWAKDPVPASEGASPIVEERGGLIPIGQPSTRLRVAVECEQ